MSHHRSNSKDLPSPWHASDKRKQYTEADRLTFLAYWDQWETKYLFLRPNERKQAFSHLLSCLYKPSRLGNWCPTSSHRWRWLLKRIMSVLLLGLYHGWKFSFQMHYLDYFIYCIVNQIHCRQLPIYVSSRHAHVRIATSPKRGEKSAELAKKNVQKQWLAIPQALAVHSQVPLQYILKNEIQCMITSHGFPSISSV